MKRQRDNREVARSLDRILALGGSAWQVNDDISGLIQRVDEAAQEAMRSTKEATEARSPSAAEHLAHAWNAIYGRNPDPSKAYSQAIKAVEAAAIPVVSPSDARAILGTVRGELRSKPHLWQLAITDPGGTSSIDAVVGMISLLWEGQLDRHGGVRPTPEITVEAAQMAVHLATTLVQWFVSGAIRRQAAKRTSVATTEAPAAAS